MTGKPQIAVPEDVAFVQFGNLLKELPKQVASVLIDPADPLAEVVRPVTIKAWRTALIQAAERGELKGSPLVAGALHGGMGEQVTADSIRSFLELRGFEVVVGRPEGEVQSRVVQSRKDDLSAVIAQAQERAADSTDTAGAWLALMQMAEAKVPPLIGIGRGEREIKYTGSDGDTKFLTKDALRKRLRRTKDGR